MTAWNLPTGLALLVACCLGQSRDLATDLQSLNVRHTTAHYALVGTVDEKTLAHYGQALELAYHEYTRGFEELLAAEGNGDASDEPDRFRVVILATWNEYEELTQAYFGAHAEHSSGMFVPAAKLLIISDAGGRERTYGTLFHEAFHQFAHRHLPAIPIWADEGLATYFGTARPAGNTLVFNRPATGCAPLVLEAAKQRKLVPLSELMTASRAIFYDQAPIEEVGASHRLLCYAQSYTLVNYMINDPEGREYLRNYLRKLAKAHSAHDAEQITREMFPQHLLDAMVQPWLQSVRP